MKFTIKSFLSIAVMITVITAVITGFEPPKVYASSMPEYIRIGLKYANSAVSQYQVYFENGVAIGVGGNDGFTELASFKDINSVSISLENGGIRVIGTKASGESTVLNEGLANANCVMSSNYETDGTVTVENKKYRGGVMFNTTSGSLNIINLLTVEQYLYGVVNGELNKSHPMEALKAQAVAARSYAACKLGNHNSYGFDLCSTTHCQVYKGFSDEYAETTEAVDETAGITVNYKDKPVAAFFYKNSGGYTQNSEDVWGGNEGYLRAVKDEYSPVYPWSKTYTAAELSSKLSAGKYNVGNVTNVTITKRNQSGSVSALQFTGTAGTAVIEKEKIRTVLGGVDIKSTMFSFGDGANVNHGANTSQKVFEASAMSKAESGTQKLGEKFFAIDKDGIVQNIKTDKAYVHNGTVTKNVEDMIEKSQTNQIELGGSETASGDTITFTGYGYGHGVGLPQDSAVEMAKKGFTYEDILKYYYTDISVEALPVS